MQSILQIATAVYLPIITAALVGVLLSLGLARSGRMVRDQPVQELLPDVLARFLYLVGIPIGVANFIRKAEFNSSVWISPVIAWSAVLLAIFLSWH
jgi:predicted permease